MRFESKSLRLGFTVLCVSCFAESKTKLPPVKLLAKSQAAKKGRDQLPCPIKKTHANKNKTVKNFFCHFRTSNQHINAETDIKTLKYCYIFTYQAKTNITILKY